MATTSFASTRKNTEQIADLIFDRCFILIVEREGDLFEVAPENGASELLSFELFWGGATIAKQKT